VFLHDADDLTDGQLLDAFLARSEEAAFAALVRRHGPMVFGVCRRVLGNRHDAEDAFQATFLVLLRKASSIRPRQAVGHWLYGVAYRTALRARTALARRRAKERQVAESRRENPPQCGEDWRPLLDEELSRLPEKYRAPIVLCDLQGRTHKEAARELGWPQGTLSGRLWRARSLLARRLTRRGLTLSATALTLASTEDAAFASLSTPLVRATAEIARAFIQSGSAAAGEMSANVAALTQGVLKAMWMTKVRIAAVVMLAASAAVGTFLHTTGAMAQPQAEDKPLVQQAAPPAAAPPRKATELPADPWPTAEQLVASLNDNARRVKTLTCDVTIDCRHRGQMVGMSGMLACRRHHDVFLQAKVVGQPAVVLGCNRDEYWFWIRLEAPEPRPPGNLWRGRRNEEGRQGPRHWPCPLRPEWLLDVLGMAEYDPAKPLSLVSTASHLELSEPVWTPGGEALRKVLVFYRNGKQIVRTPTILLKDGEKVICRAEIRQTHTDEETGAVLTREAELSWPKESLSVRLQFHDFKLNNLTSERAARLFSLGSRPATKKDEPQPAASDVPVATGTIQIDLTNTHLEMRCREEVLKLSGRPDSALSLRLLQDQLRTWAGEDKSGARLGISCGASVEYATLKGVLDACRKAGFRKIEVRTAPEPKNKQGDN
jgi:RNA polymerase sigma factor (sigma-70 family)